jgi:hypothetical protein
MKEHEGAVGHMVLGVDGAVQAVLPVADPLFFPQDRKRLFVAVL